MEIKAHKGSVLEISAPNPYLLNIDDSFVILEELSMTNLSGSHFLSLPEGKGCVQNGYNFDQSVKRLLIVLDGGNCSLTSASGSGPAFRIVIKGRSVSFIPSVSPHIHPLWTDTRLPCASSDGTYIKRVYLELELGHKISTRKDLASIKFNS
jgi:hypothetical protein